MNDRRQFLQMISATLLTPFVLNRLSAGQDKATTDSSLFAKPSKIPLAFSTLGCPGWEWPTILGFAQQQGFTAIELRGVAGKLDLPALPLFSADQIKQTKGEIRDHKLKIACVSSSAQMYVDDPAKRAQQLSDARRFIDLASTLEAPFVRVFGGKADSDKSLAPDDATKARVAA